MACLYSSFLFGTRFGFSKKISCLTVLFIAASSFCFAQKLPKFGEASQEELEMVRYKNDTAASAVVLYEEMDSRYEYDPQNLFRVVNRYFVRIKILTNEGLSQADQSVSTYIGSNRSNSETISGLSGYTYNLEGGKIERIRLSKEHIFEEKTSENLSRTKFAFQSVKPGSVIEYRYELSSPHYSQLDDYFFQRSIPVQYSRYYLKIPEYFQFSRESKGMESVSLNTAQENQTISINGNHLSFTANTYDFFATNLPGLKDEDYIWNLRDYLTRVTFELHSIIIPEASIYQTYSNTWATVDEKLLEHSNFGKQLNHKFFKEELASLFTSEMTNSDKVRAIYNMVKTKVKWNDKNNFWIDNPRDALRKGLGSSAEINAILISALREAGFNAYPVAMSRRNIGRIPLTHPTIDNFNYFIAAVDLDDNPVYMDASSKYGDLNVMSSSCLSDFARSIRGKNISSWIDLTKISKGTATTAMIARFNEQGILSGNIQEAIGNQTGYALRNTYAQSANEQEFIDKLASSQNIEVSSHEIQNVEDPGKAVLLAYEFTKKSVMAEGDYIYFNPLIIPLFSENPFKEEDRKLPVEFSYPYDHRITVFIEIPDGYQVDELPKSSRISLGEDNKATYQYLIAEDKDNHRISMSVRFTLNDVIYVQKDYPLLRDFFLHLVTSNNEQVVLKKIN